MKCFEVGIYIQKPQDFALCDVYIYNTLDTSQKERLFVLRFIYKNTDTLRYTIFHWFFEIGGGGGGGGDFMCKKKALCVTLLYAKTLHFSLRFYLQKSDTLRYIFKLKKMHFAVRIISKSYRIVLIPNYKRPYDYIDQIEK